MPVRPTDTFNLQYVCASEGARCWLSFHSPPAEMWSLPITCHSDHSSQVTDTSQMPNPKGMAEFICINSGNEFGRRVHLSERNNVTFCRWECGV